MGPLLDYVPQLKEAKEVQCITYCCSLSIINSV